MRLNPTLFSTILMLAIAPFIFAQEKATLGLEKVAEGFGLCDGPAFDGGQQLFIPDVKAQELHRYLPRTGKKNVLLNADAGRFSATFFSHGKLYLSDVANGRIAILNGNKAETYFKMPEAKPPVRSNDLVVDQQGGIYFTATRPGQVWYIEPSGRHRIVIDDIKTPNGIILSPDGSTLYVSAYLPKQVWKYEVAPGAGWQGELFATMDDGPGKESAKGADGMTIDRAGNVFCAGAEDVWVWSPSGELLEKIRTPSRPINATFAGPGTEHLYITCMAKELPGGETIPSAIYRTPRKIFGVSAPPPETPKNQVANRPSTAISDHVTFHPNVVYHTEGDRKLLVDICQPHAKAPLPCLVIVHGGGWLKGDKTKFRALANKLAVKGYVTAAVEYRLGGEAAFPAGVRDCNHAVKFLKANAEKYRIRPEKIGVVGGSAGGHIAGLMASGWKLDALAGEQIQAAVVMAGPLEMTRGQVAERSRTDPKKSNAFQWLGGNVDQKPDLYKLSCAWSHIDADTAPILFMVGEHDHPERNQASRDKLKALGVWTGVKEYKDGKHGCWNQTGWIDLMVEDMDLFFREQLR